ncbi:3'-5' exonuclease [Prauserella endophytica]|uniref:3'-5' exonuclease n=1 Tax=Prauserella endophytica TaxID=1592324 RepID=A0ABY2RT02_9PSEU|nr:3'-5' exonuclease [Prauserella endophytica]TKG59147.1 3'-5' exonuclease [Prauserella endophytica]
MSLVDLGGDPRMRRTRLLVLDFEGLTPAGRSPEPIEVAATKLEYRSGALVEIDRFESLIQPPAGIPVTWRERAVGFTPAMLADAPPAREVMAALDRLLPAPDDETASWPYRVVAHGAATERTLIYGQRQHCPNLAATPLLDNVRLARTVLTGLTHHGLNDVARHLGIPIPADRHRAMADVELTVTVLTRLLELGAWRGLHDLERDARLEPKHPATDPAEQESLF